MEQLARAGLSRSDIVIALGGGITGDMAGFAAATYLRGIRYIQIPTTYLAAVDSSVGGKTAVDLGKGKNLCGAFWQPSLVLCDYTTFRTLSPSEMLDGSAESYKSAMIGDAELAAPVREIMSEIPTELIPRHPVSGKELTTNLRSDDRFVEDEGWYKASAAYADFIREHNGKHVLFLEIGVGNNTPVIIKYPFWQMTDENPRAFYACLNYSEAYCPSQIKDRSVCIKGDSGEVIREILRYDG